jgi:hypothetical protein
MTVDTTTELPPEEEVPGTPTKPLPTSDSQI